MKDNLLKLLGITFVVFSLAACSGEDGTNEEDGTDGSNGSDGTNGDDGSNGFDTLMIMSVEPEGENCPTGGMKYENGLDTNRNGQLDNNEITEVTFQCNSYLEVENFDYTISETKNINLTWRASPYADYYELLEKKTTDTEYSIIAELDGAEESYNQSIFTPDTQGAQYKINSCDEKDCESTAPMTIDSNMIDAIGSIKADDAQSLANFGYATAINADGNVLAVGSNLKDDGQNVNKGSVYIFELVDNAWNLKTEIKAIESDAYDMFGSSIALSGDGTRLAVSAPNESSKSTGIDNNRADNSMPSSGAVYVFDNVGGVWGSGTYIKASNTDSNDEFGSSISLNVDGSILAVGALGESSAATGINGNQLDNSAKNSGAVYLFSIQDNVWSQSAYIKASNTDAKDQFGFSISIASSGLLVGAPNEKSGINGNQDDNTLQNAGATYFFIRDGTTWSQDTYLKSSNPTAGANFGNSVAISSSSGNAVIGSYSDDISAINEYGELAEDSLVNSGGAYIFNRDNHVWIQKNYLKAPNAEEGDLFGSYVAINLYGNTIAISSLRESSSAVGINGDESDNSSNDSGAVYTYVKIDDNWVYQSYIKSINTSENDGFGSSLSLDRFGDTLAVGAINEDDSGAVYIY